MEILEEKIKNELINCINCENFVLLIKILNSSYFNQKIFIELIEQIINNTSLENNDNFLITYEKLNKLLPNIIHELGIPFGELLNEHQKIINYYYYLYLSGNSKHKLILLSFIDIFNFESLEKNPSDDLIEKMQLKDSKICDCIKNSKRKDKNEIEILYDEISSLFSNLRIRINIEDVFDIKVLNYFNISIKEKLNKILEWEKLNKYSKSVIEFFKEKISKFEKLFKTINIENNSLNNFNEHNLENESSEKNVKKVNYFSDIKDIETSKKISANSYLTISEFDINKILRNLKEIPLKNRTSFYKEEQLNEGEDEFTEFKNYYLPLEEDKVEELKRQFCAFLNNKGGRLYIGINDQKIVKGVILNYKECDDLRNLLVNFTYDFYPKCRLDKIKVYFIPIKNMKDNKFINDLYVVKIIIMQGEPYILYSMTTKGFKSAIRLQGQCANLTAEEITKEIIRRGKLGELQNFEYSNDVNEQFNDPEPEINFEKESEIDEFNFKEKFENKNEIINQKNNYNNTNKRDIYVVEIKNIDNNLNIKELNNKFKECGCIYQKFFSKDGKSRGYGFLKFSDKSLAISTIKKFNNLQINGKKISLMLKK